MMQYLKLHDMLMPLFAKVMSSIKLTDNRDVMRNVITSIFALRVIIQLSPKLHGTTAEMLDPKLVKIKSKYVSFQSKEGLTPLDHELFLKAKRQFIVISYGSYFIRQGI